jgi:sugar/nucleoside kinase (ribokinase family)
LKASQVGEILVVGSLAYDTISTPAGRAERTLGGSANYFSLAARLYAPVRVVGVVGDDYRPEDRALLTERQVDLEGVQTAKGQTFHWTGSYEKDMNEATTLATELNVFAGFNPELPARFATSPYVFLANIDPILQMRVLEQVKAPKIVGSDTMNYWIHSKLPDLKKVLSRVDVLLINEGESELLSGKTNAIAAAREISAMGPRAIVIKRGEYGFVLYTKEEGYFILPAFPVVDVVDPTGAGDTFAGAFFGTLARAGALSTPRIQTELLRAACIQGSLLASLTVEGMGLARLRQVSWADVEAREAQYLKTIRWP